MRRLCAGLMVVLVSVAGCKKESSPGGPGAPNDNLAAPPDNKQTEDRYFRLTAPREPTVVRRGGEAKVTIGIERGPAFKEKVDVDFKKVPRGVSFTPAKGTIAPDQKESQFTVRAAADAAVGVANVEVVGVPEPLGRIPVVALPLKVE